MLRLLLHVLLLLLRRRNLSGMIHLRRRMLMMKWHLLLLHAVLLPRLLLLLHLSVHGLLLLHAWVHVSRRVQRSMGVIVLRRSDRGLLIGAAVQVVIVRTLRHSIRPSVTVGNAHVLLRRPQTGRAASHVRRHAWPRLHRLSHSRLRWSRSRNTVKAHHVAARLGG